MKKKADSQKVDRDRDRFTGTGSKPTKQNLNVSFSKQAGSLNFDLSWFVSFKKFTWRQGGIDKLNGGLHDE